MREGMSFTEAVRGLDSATAENEGGHGPYLSSNQFAYLERAATGPGRLGEMLTAVPARAHGVAVGLWHASFTGAPVILVVAAAGLATFPWFRDVWLAGLLLFAIGALQIAFVLTLEFVWSRFYFPLLPLIIPWFAGGLARALELATRSAPGGAAGTVGRLAQIACLSILVGTVV